MDVLRITNEEGLTCLKLTSHKRPWLASKPKAPCCPWPMWCRMHAGSRIGDCDETKCWKTKCGAMGDTLACVRDNTTFAAAQSMPTALHNLCRVRSPNQAITLSSKCESLLRSEFSVRVEYFAHVVRTACWSRLVSDCFTRSGVMGS